MTNVPEAHQTEGESGEIAPAVLDFEHLDRQTMGERALADEVLGLFVSQSRGLFERLDVALDLDERARLFHTLAGSARGIGAWQVAALAGTCEADPAASVDLTSLRRALAAVEAMIAARTAAQ